MRIVTPILTNLSTLEAMRYDAQKTLIDVIKEDVGADASISKIIGYFIKEYLAAGEEGTGGTYTFIGQRYQIPEASYKLFEAMIGDEISPSIIFKYGRYPVAYQDKDELKEQVNAWCFINARKWLLQADNIAKYIAPYTGDTETETITETTENTGTNTSTANVTSANTTKESSNDYPIYDSTSQGFDEDKYQSGSRKQQQNGSSEASNNATATGSTSRNYTRKYETSNGKLPPEVQAVYLDKIRNIVEGIVKDFAQFLNGNMYAY